LRTSVPGLNAKIILNLKRHLTLITLT